MHSMQGQGNPCEKPEKNTGHLFKKDALFFVILFLYQSVHDPVRQKVLLQ